MFRFGLRVNTSIRSFNTRLAAALAVALLFASVAVIEVAAQSPTSQYFPETGHTVEGEFLKFFSERGGLKVFGYPITEAFNFNGRRIQYFQKARMELHPENPPAYLVQLGLLGDELGRRMSPTAPQANDPYHRYYPETGHTVAYAFLNFYDINGGLDIFGYPITDFVAENGRIVQYFQRARMEWHPELSGDQRVQLGDLGSIQFEAARLDPTLKRPRPALPGTPQAPLSLRATASVRQPITGRSGNQTVYVYVTDQQGNGLQNTAATAIIHYPAPIGDRLLSLRPTDANGFTSASFGIEGPPGQVVVIEVRIGYLELQQTAQTSFLPWY
jgi:hypothetical protein